MAISLYQGVPGKIPPNCTLTFEVTLLWWKAPGDIVLTPDGGILKTISRPGTGAKAGASSEVSLGVTVRRDGQPQELGTMEGEVAALKILDLPSRRGLVDRLSSVFRGDVGTGRDVGTCRGM